MQRCVCTSGEERCKGSLKVLPANSRKHNYVVGATIIVGCVAMLDSLVVLSYYKTIPDTRSQTAMVGVIFKTNGKLQSSNVVLDLFLILIIKFVLTAACLSLPIPSGLFMPVCSGAQWAPLWRIIFLLEFDRFKFCARRICGCRCSSIRCRCHACNFDCGNCHRSYRQYHMLLPVSIGVLAAYFVANRFAKPVYDCLVTANAFPQLPKVSYRLGRECAEVASQPATPHSVFCLSSTKADFENMLRQNPRTMLFPVVENFENMILLGEIQRRNIESAFERANRAASSESDGNREAGYDSERIHFVISAPHELNTSKLWTILQFQTMQNH